MREYLAARFVITLVGLPLYLLFYYYAGPEKLQTIPCYVSLTAGALVVIWWYPSKKKADLAFLLCAGYGAGLLAFGIADATETLLTQDDLDAWLRDSMSNGKLPYYGSFVLFGGSLAWRGFCRTLASASIAQNVVFTTALFALAYGYILNDSLALLSILSWLIFPGIADWTLIEKYVIEKRGKMSKFHFYRIIAMDAVILGISAYIVSQFWPQRLGGDIGIGLLLYGFGAVGGWITTIASLSGYVKTTAQRHTVAPARAVSNS